MELEDLEELSNITQHEIYNSTEHELFDFYMNIRRYYQLPIFLIGAACDIIMATMIIKNKLMYTRINKILVVWVLCDLGVILFSPSFIYDLDELFENTFMESTCYCIIFNGDSMFQFFLTFAIIALFSNYLMQLKNENVYKTIIAVLSTIAIGIFISYLIKCYTYEYFYSMILYYVMFFMGSGLLLTLIGKEVYYLYLRCRGRLQLTPEEQFRLNIVRIYIYTWIVCQFSLEMTFYVRQTEYLYIPLHIIYTFGFLTPSFILGYIVSVDKRFQICFLNLIKCKSEQYDVNATISFSEQQPVDYHAQDAASIDIQINKV